MRKQFANPGKPHRVVVLGLPGVNGFDLATVAQVFGRAAPAGHYSVSLCTNEPGIVPTVAGYGIQITEGLQALAGAHTVVVPGHDRRPVPVAVVDALKAAHDQGCRIASICTGAFVLAEAGLLAGRRATTHWASASDLQASHPDIEVVADELYVDNDDLLTGGGISAGIDLCLHLVERDLGREAAITAARNMVAPLHRRGGQRQYTPPQQGDDQSGSSGLREAIAWARQHLHQRITVADLAARAHQSPRTFLRSFGAQMGMPPKAWLIEQRIAAARVLLEDGRLPVDAVAARTGFGTAANLRTHFGRAHQLSPSAYRDAFTGRNPSRS